jgi:hypothetical protein
MELLSEYYLSNNAIYVEPPPKSISIDQVEFKINDNAVDMNKLQKERKITELTDKELVKFGFNLSHKFRNKVKIQTVRLPDIFRNEYQIISAEISGTISKGFIDLFIRDSENNDFWFPDEETWNKNKDEGKLELNNGYKYCSWSFTIPDYSKENFRIYVLVFEDSDGNTRDKRKVAGGVEVFLKD